jgi:Tfp pilus assembly protein PilF
MPNLLMVIFAVCYALSSSSAEGAQSEVDRLISRGHANGWVYAQRGFARRGVDDFQGAVQDFDAALDRGDLDRHSIANIGYARAEAAAMLAERDGNPHMAEASYRELLRTEPTQADAWYKLGYLLLQHKRFHEGADALNEGLKIRPAGPPYLDAANAYIFTNASLASKLYREGLNRWYAGDPDLASRPESELERVKNEVVEADATIRTTMASSAIAGRPETAGGTNISVGAETAVRFDGRYLPAVPGLEGLARGLSGKDSNGERETDAGIGLRYRPIRDLNLYFGGVVDHFFQPKPITELVLTWGLGLGANPYPYSAGWQPYWDFGAIGGWRTAEARVLQDVRANAGWLYEFRSPVRGAIGPTLFAVAGYDNKATNPLAAGVGPSVMSYFWLGGDKYRSYDSVLSLQFGYLFNVGKDERQRGWRGQVGVTF